MTSSNKRLTSNEHESLK